MNRLSELISQYVKALLSHYQVKFSDGQACNAAAVVAEAGGGGVAFVDAYQEGMDRGKCGKGTVIVNVEGRNGISGEALEVSTEMLETFIKGLGGNAEPYEKPSHSYFAESIKDVDSFKALAEAALGGQWVNQVENLVLRIYATGKALYYRESEGSRASYLRDRHVGVLLSLGAVSLNDVLRKGQQVYGSVSLTDSGLVLAQKLSQERFLEKQSVVGIWLDRHMPEMAFLTAFSTVSGPFLVYPNCALVKRDPESRIHHEPCATCGAFKCAGIRQPGITRDIALAADTLLASRQLSPMIYQSLYELTASYLAYVSWMEMGGEEAEVACVIPELVRSVIDATLPDFKKTMEEKGTKDRINGYALAALAGRERMNRESILALSRTYGTPIESIEEAAKEMESAGVLSVSDGSYVSSGPELIEKFIESKMEEEFAELQLF